MEQHAWLCGTFALQAGDRQVLPIDRDQWGGVGALRWLVRLQHCLPDGGWDVRDAPCLCHLAMRRLVLCQWANLRMAKWRRIDRYSCSTRTPSLPPPPALPQRPPPLASAEPAFGWTLPTNLTANAARMQLAELRQRGWLDLQTRTLRVYITVYNVAIDLYCAVRLNIEITAEGGPPPPAPTTACTHAAPRQTAPTPHRQPTL